MYALLVDLVFLFLSLYVVNQDVTKNNYSRKVFWIWIISTTLAYFLLWIYGVVAVLIIYLIWSKLYGKKKVQEESDQYMSIGMKEIDNDI